MTYTYESFITYCDNYDVCNEGFIESIKAGIKKALLAILNALDKLFSKGKDNKIKSKIKELISRAKIALGEADNIKTQEDADKVKKKTNAIKKEMAEFKNEPGGNKPKLFPDGTKKFYYDSGLIKKIIHPNGDISELYENGKIKRETHNGETTVFDEKTGKPIYKRNKNGLVVRYNSAGKVMKVDPRKI